MLGPAAAAAPGKINPFWSTQAVLGTAMRGRGAGSDGQEGMSECTYECEYMCQSVCGYVEWEEEDGIL